MASEKKGKKYMLLVVHGDNQDLDLLLALSIGSEIGQYYYRRPRLILNTRPAA